MRTCIEWLAVLSLGGGVEGSADQEPSSRASFNHKPVADKRERKTCEQGTAERWAYVVAFSPVFLKFFFFGREVPKQVRATCLGQQWTCRRAPWRMRGSRATCSSCAGTCHVHTCEKGRTPVERRKDGVKPLSKVVPHTDTRPLSSVL